MFSVACADSDPFATTIRADHTLNHGAFIRADYEGLDQKPLRPPPLDASFNARSGEPDDREGRSAGRTIVFKTRDVPVDL